MNEIINYVAQTPENTNSNILRDMLEGLYDKPKEEAITEINVAGTNQISEIQLKGQEVLNSIPEDYSELSGDVAELKSAFDDISQVSRNLWPFVSDASFTRYKIFTDPDNGVILPAGTYVISSQVTGDGAGQSCLIRFDNSSNNEIAHTNITKSYTDRNSHEITLSEDCYRIWLFSDESSSASVGVSATWNEIQIESGNYYASSYVPHFSARDTVLESRVNELNNKLTTSKIGNKRLLPESVNIDSLNFITTGANLFDYDNKWNENGLINSNGNVVPHDSYKTSWFIHVEPETVYYLGGYFTNNQYKSARNIVEYDKDLNIVNFIAASGSIETGATTEYIRFSYSSASPSNKVYCGLTDWDGSSAAPYSVVIDEKYLPDPTTPVTTKGQYSVTGNLNSGDTIYTKEYANSIRSNERIIFNADVTSFDSLEIGFAWSGLSYKYNRFVIDGTSLTVYDYAGNADVTEHHLRIENNIQVLIESNFSRNCDVTIISNGVLFKATSKKLDRRRVCFPFAHSIGSVLPNAKLAWTCVDFDKPIWIFGDSYVASFTDRWPKYVYTYGYSNNCLFDAFPGEGSGDSLISLQHLLTLAKPKTIIWCLGMNDGSDGDTEPSTNWKTAQTTLRELCDEANIQLILATIPTVPSINNARKNANVRASGYRYIDFARAVENPNYNPNTDEPIDMWFSGMLYPGTEQIPDFVHPTDAGAKALFGRAVLDAPEIMITP